MNRTRFLRIGLIGTLCLLAPTMLHAAGRKLIKRVPPQYPILAAKMKVQGTVTLEAQVDKAGDVVAVKVVSGHDLLRAAAMDAVKEWKWEPASTRTVEVVGVAFTLQG
jgi:TonB family protein